jgi:hypothetical protein
MNEIEAELVNLVRHTLSDTLTATGAVASESVTLVSGVMQGTIQATEEVGTGVIVSMKNVTQHLVTGVRDIGGNVLTVAGKPSRIPWQVLLRLAPIWRRSPPMRCVVSLRPPQQLVATSARRCKLQRPVSSRPPVS